MNGILTALMYFTRIPVPRQLPFSPELLGKALRYFPLVGFITGVLGALVLWLAWLVFPLPLALLLSMAATIILTGAFHEDGFADFCDGYGGNGPAIQILEIMKDSRLGTYGTIGLLGILSAKFTALLHLPLSLIFVALIGAHVVSRLLPVWMVYITPYTRDDASSKAKPVASQASKLTVIIATVTGVIPLLLFNWASVLAIVVALLFWFFIFRWYIIKRTGGYTGDVLGALQQSSEVLIYIVLLALNFQ